MQAWAPEAIVAPLEIALSLAEKRLGGLVDLSNLTAAVVLTDIDGEALSEDRRELLWKAFGVPVFEQLRSREGAIVARECEVHDGLHVDPEARVAHELSALSAAMTVSEPCECGSETPRLRGYLSTRTPEAPAPRVA
jgi:phenylacetate-coenzyme A ligase PaaK-like adenylate-forming protein